MERTTRTTAKKAMAALSLRFVFAAFIGMFASAVLAAEVPREFVRLNSSRTTLDATAVEWTIKKVATRISKATGWTVHYDPQTDFVVSVKIRQAPLGEGLRRLLGDLNYVLTPTRDGSTRLTIYQTTPSQATAVIEGRQDRGRSKAKNLIGNELVVALDPDGEQSIDELARLLGAKVIGRSDEENTFRLSFEDKAAADSAREKMMTEHDNVLGVDDNFRIDRPSPGTPNVNTAARSTAGFGLKAGAVSAGDKTIIGLIDMPVQAVQEGMAEFLLPGISVTGDAKPELTGLSHGTSMAQTVLQGLDAATPPDQTSSVRLLPVDVYGSNGSTTTFDVARGLIAAVNSGATVVNLSLGGEGDSAFLNDLITDIRSRGVMVLAAAGNEPTTAPTWPAAHPGVLAVSAADRRGNVASYANRGEFVDLLAPGTSMVEFDNQPYYVSGTSTATAFVSGVAAAHYAAGQTPAQIQTYLQNAFPMRDATPDTRWTPRTGARP